MFLDVLAGNRASLEPVLFESLFPQGFPGSNPGGGVGCIEMQQVCHLFR
jgi:hypothetical protein